VEQGVQRMNSLFSENSGFTPAGGDMPAAISSLIDGAVAAFDADRNTSRRYLMRASALLRARRLASTAARDAQEARPTGALRTWQVNRVIDYIETHLSEKITVQDLAGLLNLSIGQLFRSFKISVGTPPCHYILLRRFELACTIMTTTREPLSQVAIASGLCDQSHLCRVFQRLAGISPAVWRRANESEPKYGQRRTRDSGLRRGYPPVSQPSAHSLMPALSGRVAERVLADGNAHAKGSAELFHRGVGHRLGNGGDDVFMRLDPCGSAVSSDRSGAGLSVLPFERAPPAEARSSVMKRMNRGLTSR
jgi:AraC family transcriptional regulator